MTELEKMQRAKMYIDKLANGIDPLTDSEISDDSVLNQVRISRCLFYVSDILSMVIDNGGEVGRKYVVKQLPFTITPEQISSVEITEEPVGVSIIAKRIAAVIDENIKSVPATHISNWLVKNGYLQENIRSNKKTKVATTKGETIGIYTIDSVSSMGVPYQKNIYSPEAQRFVIENIVKIEENMSRDGE